MPAFSTASKDRLYTCDTRLVTLFTHVIQVYDCTVIEGHRDPARQKEVVAAGKSKVDKSKHNFSPSLAADVAPYPIPENWGVPESGRWSLTDAKTLAKFYHFGGFVCATAFQMGIPVRWGGDWDGDREFTDQTFDDLVHFELVG